MRALRGSAGFSFFKALRTLRSATFYAARRAVGALQGLTWAGHFVQMWPLQVVVCFEFEDLLPTSLQPSKKIVQGFRVATVLFRNDLL